MRRFLAGVTSFRRHAPPELIAEAPSPQLGARSVTARRARRTSARGRRGDSGTANDSLASRSCCRSAPRPSVAAPRGARGRRCTRHTTSGRSRHAAPRDSAGHRCHRHRASCAAAAAAAAGAQSWKKNSTTRSGLDRHHLAVEHHRPGQAMSSPPVRSVLGRTLPGIEDERRQVDEVLDVRVRARVADHRTAVGMTDEHDRAVDRVERPAQVVAVGGEVGAGLRHRRVVDDRTRDARRVQAVRGRRPSTSSRATRRVRT